MSLTRHQGLQGTLLLRSLRETLFVCLTSVPVVVSCHSMASIVGNTIWASKEASVMVASLALSLPCGDLAYIAHISLEAQDLLPFPGGSTLIVPLRGSNRNMWVRNLIWAYCLKIRKLSSSEGEGHYPPFRRKEKAQPK